MAFYELIMFIFQILPVFSSPYKLYKFRPHSNLLFLPIAVMPKKRSRPNLVVKSKILHFGDSNLNTWFSGFSFAVASVHS